MIVFVYNFRDVLLKNQYTLLLVGLFFAGLSISIDAIKDLLHIFHLLQPMYRAIGAPFHASLDKMVQVSVLLEDSTKFFGIIGWMLFCIRFSLDQLKESTVASRAEVIEAVEVVEASQPASD